MSRLSPTRLRHAAMPGLDATPLAPPAAQNLQPTPTVAGTLYEISLVFALHLALVLAVLLTLQAFGVN